MVYKDSKKAKIIKIFQLEVGALSSKIIHPEVTILSYRDALKPDFFQNPGFGPNPGSVMNYPGNSRFLWTLDSRGPSSQYVVRKYIKNHQIQRQFILFR